MTEFLPRASAPAVDSSGRFTRETYDALRRTIAALNDADASLNERQREILAILNALGADDVESLEALGPLLDGKQDASEVLDAVAAIIGTGIAVYTPGAFVGRSIAPVAGETTVANGSGLAGDPTVGLADLANSGAGSLLAITRDAKGRVSGTKAATITGTAGRVTVANGDASAGLPTVDLATVADAGGGTLLRIVRDAWGRITGTSAPTTTDLAEGTNLYHTAARVRDTVLTGLSTATNAVITATDTVLTALGKLQAQISGLIVQTITNGDTTHAPSGDAVFDALALKFDKAGGTISGDTTIGSFLYADTVNGRLGLGVPPVNFQFEVSGPTGGLALYRTGGGEPFVMLTDDVTGTNGGQVRGVIGSGGLKFTNRAATTEWGRWDGPDFKITGGRLYGSALHNNAAGLTGATNQYVGSGTYTPTLTNVTNIDASTAFDCHFVRVGNVVYVSGSVNIDATSGSVLTEIGISLPIATNFTSYIQCTGTATSQAAGAYGQISGDTTAHRARLIYTNSTATTNRAWFFSFSYLVL